MMNTNKNRQLTDDEVQAAWHQAKLERDRAAIEQAMAELGTTGNISDLLRRAQEIKETL